jgi:hypothetical protein
MGFHVDYRGETKAAGINYVVTVEGLGTDERLDLHLAGTTAEGAVLAEGTLRLPPGGMAPAAKLLKQALDAIGKLDPPKRPGRPVNANRPWTTEQDALLREEWLAATPVTPAAQIIRELAQTRQRSATAIRARLPHLGCDPDVPGRTLSDQAAELLGPRYTK